MATLGTTQKRALIGGKSLNNDHLEDLEEKN
jgi:hypothetical protein